MVNWIARKFLSIYARNRYECRSDLHASQIEMLVTNWSHKENYMSNVLVLGFDAVYYWLDEEAV